MTTRKENQDGRRPGFGSAPRAGVRGKFDGNKRWRLWNGPVLAKYVNGRVLYLDELDPANAGEVRWHVGVEVHKLNVVMALYGRRGEDRVLGPIVEFETTPRGLLALERLAREFAPVRFLMEISGVYHIPVYWALEAAFPGSQVVAMNARALHNYIIATRKGDRVDAARLAQVASYEELLRPSVVPGRDLLALRELTRYRERLVRDQTRQKNRIKKVLSAHGFHWQFNFQSGAQLALLDWFLDGKRLPATGAGGSSRNAFDPWRDVELGDDCRALVRVLLPDL